MTTLWIKNPLAIYGQEADCDAGGGVVTRGSEIVELVAAGGAPATPYDETFDASQHVLLPGLINTHHHFYQTLTRALPDALNKSLFPWLQSLYKVWAHLDADMVRLATEMASAELLLSGCTTAADHHYLFPMQIDNAIDIQAEAVRKMGIRALLTRGSMSLGEKDGGLPPQSVVQDEQSILDDSLRLIRAYHDGNDGSMLQIALAPCSPFSVTRELMQETNHLASREGVLLHTHLAETEDENDFCLRVYGVRPVEYLAEVGWMHEGVWLAHGIHFTDEEMDELGRRGVGVAHCPSSNMLLGSGVCQTLDLQKRGAPVGLAVDGSASNDCSNMIQEVRQALLIQRLRYAPGEITHQWALDLATKGSAKLLKRPELGVLGVGKQADLALFKLDENRFSGSGDPLAALVLCGAHQADAVMVAGRWRVKNSVLMDVDMARLRAEHTAAALRLRQAACS
ncbi:Cytosine deaminase and related metal-dependent Hydrolase [Hahella chejuensis KCTC 2396]|uniref:Cytosine deaminase and related metal-dependent Hydrolase n=1 Tax=Hahella chejuensis (strain KCTC 2396) TaxID=349521 RepID=Q2SMY9_HAHCH|nr:8-oxoguanine deaminase [Hahella chejuensis]ABC27985.1 Cytosine deaminase and related metal-dependent Hydrolase [Hahella chejuensis KCTC 2396]